jgi:hypothetical protein
MHFRCKNQLFITPGIWPTSLKVAGSQPVASIRCKSYEGPPLSFMASDSEPKKYFQSTDARRRVLEHFGLKNQHLAANGFLPAIFALFKLSFLNSDMSFNDLTLILHL